jgi:hypothetical protein
VCCSVRFTYVFTTSYIYSDSEVNPIFINGKTCLYWYIMLVSALRKMVEGVDGGGPRTGCGM